MLHEHIETNLTVNYRLGEVHLALAWLEELLLGFDKYFSHDCKFF